ncbi:hypothetical protein [Paenibacillus wynnii]|uniref:Uncharacterized protein n=1 Tax=Paenibacillus wynnii TaxID=268407 RepID=A0A098MD24_9BACL|nr:hypothetical protein [Paenibacillus wynnii]KGE20464.1 hypothetical protein PWYN_14785 [Paenibacillus wynnii]
MVIRLRNVTLILGILMALISLMLFGANFAFFIILTYSILISVGYRFIKTNVDIIPLLTITISFLLYNIIYIILKKADVIDLYSVDWRLEVQLMLPSLLGFLIKGFVRQYQKNY